MNLAQIFQQHPKIPVVVVNSIDEADHYAKQAEARGLGILEITLRTEMALDAIKYVRKNYPQLVVGAGTVMDEIQMLDAKAVGAHFAVTPGLNEHLCRLAREHKIPYMPGAVTPTEIMNAKAWGYTLLKFFPAEVSGGIVQLKAYQPLFTDITFCATGGVNAENCEEYLALPNVVAVGGSWLLG